jgi:Asp-tRNA(Asn)/Glu-tRNA(Gln) amidotransferase A subunit family amidase
MTEHPTGPEPWIEAADAVPQVEEAARRIAAREPELQAFRELHLDAAKACAKELDALTPEARGPLHGLPIGVKEVFDVAGMRCEWGTPIHAGRMPERDSALVRDLKAAGAVVVGITSATEYAMAREAPTVNPFDPERTPGASSSGSAVAVGAGLVPCALGSQTIGSGIRPAAYCGVLGLKPSRGVLSIEGGMPLSAHLDHPAIFASDFDILERVFAVLAGDHAGVPDDLPPGAGKIVVTPPWFDEAVDDSVLAAVDSAAALFAGMGYAVEPREVGHLVSGEDDCLMTILTHDVADNHGGDHDRASDQMSEFMRGLIEAGRRVNREQYDEAVARKSEITAALEEWLPENGIVLTAAVTGPAPLRSEGTGSRAPQRLWTLSGWPALAVPGWWAGHLPVGVQLVARGGADRRLLSVGRRLFEALRAS